MASPFVVADAAVAVSADLKQYDADLRQAEEKGRSSGSRLAAALRSDLGRGVAAAAGLAFGIASKGLLELDQIQQQFAADTGATAEEAREAGKAILDMSKRNLQPMQEIGAALSKVHTDLGLTGDEANAATEKILKFATATGQNAADAVADLDDILDAWGLTAEDAGHVLDNLKASHEEYGGSIAENQKSLAALAPQLRALNLDVDDGQALLNLFAASGLDASKAQFALNSAIKNLPPGTTLDDVIRRLSSISDPAVRAREAIEIFGARGGPALANVLQPGIDSLDDFALAASDIEGASERAADAIESSFGNQVKLRLKEFSGALIEAGRNFGPVLTGLASTASLASALRLDVPIRAAFGRLGSSALVKSAAGKAGALIGVAFTAGLMIADRISTALLGVPANGAVRAAAAKAGDFFGTSLGKAAAAGFAAVLVLEAVNLYNRLKDEFKAEAAGFWTDINAQILSGTNEQLLQSAAALREGMKRLQQTDIGGVNAQAWGELRAQLQAVEAELERRAFDFGHRAADAVADGVDAGAPAVAAAAVDLADGIPTGLERAEQRVAGAARRFLAMPIADQLIEMGPEARLAAARVALDVASGLRDRRGAIDAAMQQLRDDIKNKLTPKKEVAHDIGLLFGKTLSRGLRSADPVVKAQAEGTRALIENQLIETIKAGGKAGTEILAELEKKMKSKDPAVREQARRTKSVIDAALKAQTGPRTPGDKITADLARDISGGTGIVGTAAYKLGRSIAINLLRGIQGSGAINTGSSTNGSTGRYAGKDLPAFATGIDYVPADMLALIHKGEAVLNPKDADRFRSGLAGLAGPLVAIGSIDASGHRDPEAVGEAVARKVEGVMASVLRDESLRGLVGVRS